MSDSAYFEQIEQKINHLLSEKKYAAAYSLCKEFLLKYPDEKFFFKLKKRVEDEIRDENQSIIKEKLNELQPLWDEGKYEEILKILRELSLLNPENGKIKSWYRKASSAYQEKLSQLTSQFTKKQSEKLNQLLEKDPDRLLDELFYIERNNAKNIEILRMTNFFRDKLITKKISTKQDFLKSEKYDSINNFIEDLKRIDPNNNQIKKLQDEVLKRKSKSQSSEKISYIYKSEKQLETLMKLKKYDKALKAAQEILSIDPNNAKVQKILQKAERKFFKQSREATIDLIMANRDQLKEQYKKDKTKFIKI